MAKIADIRVLKDGFMYERGFAHANASSLVGGYLFRGGSRRPEMATASLLKMYATRDYFLVNERWPSSRKELWEFWEDRFLQNNRVSKMPVMTLQEAYQTACTFREQGNLAQAIKTLGYQLRASEIKDEWFIVDAIVPTSNLASPETLFLALLKERLLRKGRKVNMHSLRVETFAEHIRWVGAPKPIL